MLEAALILQLWTNSILHGSVSFHTVQKHDYFGSQRRIAVCPAIAQWDGEVVIKQVLVMLSLFAWKWRSWSSYSAKNCLFFFWWPAHKSKLQIRLTGVSPLLRLVTTLKATVHLLSGNKPPTHPLHEQWVTYARASVQDGIDYFNNQLSSSLKTFGGL